MRFLERFMNWRKRFLSIAIFFLMLWIPQNGNSCGPFIPDAVFVYHMHPGGPLPQYARGNLGVVLPDFYPHYLFVAYRYFAGKPLRADEVDQVVSFWKWRLISPWAQDKDVPDPVNEWMEARKQLAPAEPPPQISPDLTLGNYSTFHNCLPDAFHNAALTLKERAQRFGAASNDVQEWLRGQDMVFEDCGAQKNIPSPVAESSPTWLKADRRYQIGAAYFYSGKFDEAAHEFDQIAADSASPWHSMAPYLAARATIRKATLKDENSPFDQAVLKEAQTRLQKIVADPSLAGIHAAGNRLLAYIAIRLDPAQRIGQLAPLLSAEHPDSNLRQDLIDYVHGLSANRSDPPDFGRGSASDRIQVNEKEKEWKEQQFAGWAGLRSHDDLTDWILTFGDSSIPSRQHALEQWRKLRSVPWLVAAMTKVEATSPDAAELMKAAERVPAAYPAYPTVSYQRLRVLMESGQGDKARTLLDTLLPQLRKSINPASLNLFLIMQMKLARSFDEFLNDAALPVIESDDGSGEGPWSGYCGEKDCPEVFAEKKDQPAERRFDPGTAGVFNRYLPLQKLALAAQSKGLPEKLRGELAASTWTRAVMLGHYDVAASLLPEINGSYPTLKAPLAAYAAAVTDATDKDKWHAALFILLSHPGLRPDVNAGFARGANIEEIDSFRDNWWCAEADLAKTGAASGAPGKDAAPYPAFLSSAEANAAKTEVKQLTAAGAGPDYLATKTLAWAKDQPDDPRVPEALHLAVRSTRYGCAGKQTSGLSRKAFELLHDRYPKSKWTKQTPYWF